MTARHAVSRHFASGQGGLRDRRRLGHRARDGADARRSRRRRRGARLDAGRCRQGRRRWSRRSDAGPSPSKAMPATRRPWSMPSTRRATGSGRSTSRSPAPASWATAGRSSTRRVADFERVMGVNVRGSFLLVREAARQMRPRQERRHHPAVEPRRAAGRARHVLLLHVEGRAAQPGARRRARPRARAHHGELRLSERHQDAAARGRLATLPEWRRSAALLCRAAPARAGADAARHRRGDRLRRLAARDRHHRRGHPGRCRASAPPGTISARRPGRSRAPPPRRCAGRFRACVGNNSNVCMPRRSASTHGSAHA